MFHKPTHYKCVGAGNINTMETYVNGQKSGKYIHYNQNGTIKKEGFISDK